MVEMIVDRLDAVLFCFIGDLPRCVLRQKMGLDDVATLTVSDQSALAGNDRPVQLKLALETNAVLMASSGGDYDFSSVLTQPAHGSRILFADFFIRAKKCAVQINRRQFKRELRCKLIVVSRGAHRKEFNLRSSPKISSKGSSLCLPGG